jgi:hypothetical protein
MIQHNQTSNSKFNGLMKDINLEYYLDIKPKGQYLGQTILYISYFLKPTIMGNTKEK